MIISGGTLPDPFVALISSEVDLCGLAFLIDGQPLPGLSEGQTRVIEARAGALSAVLADGSTLDLDLDPSAGGDVIASTATLRVTRVPCGLAVLAEPLALFDSSDIAELLRRIDEELPTADINDDGSPNMLDLISWLARSNADCE